MGKALIIGVCGLTLTQSETDFIAQQKPAALILFARNIQDKTQVKALVQSYRDCVGKDEAGREAPVLIDQEGGKVQRLRPPLAPNYPSAEAINSVFQKDEVKGRRAAFLAGRLIGDDLHELGIDVDCDPVLDLRIRGAHDIIGSRAYGDTVEAIVTLAQAKVDGLLAAGVLPVIKHIPGHGRASSDSHLELPVVMTSHAELSQTDFAPFKPFSKAAFAMTAHVVYSDIDSWAPATTSNKLIANIIRGEIGYDGCLMTDDLGMKALSGSFASRAQKAIEAGCDLLLHCSGNMDEMREIAPHAPELNGKALERFNAALAQRKAPQDFDRRNAEIELKNLLADAGVESAFEMLVA